MITDILNEADQKMDKSVEATREDFSTIRAGRANPAMFAKLTADYYGTQTPLQQLASFTSQDARTIIVSPFDMGALPNIERAIRDSDLGVNPASDGKSTNPRLSPRPPMMDRHAPRTPSAGMSTRRTWSSLAVFHGARRWSISAARNSVATTSADTRPASR